MADYTRPDPDALLAQVAEEEPQSGKGRLRIYLGMAAGVGKTFTMLADAQEQVRRGKEVVLGYLEPHGRVETESLADGLERLPLKVISHRGVEIKEFDVDAALARRPAQILVDELAHTNAPESRHAKRWQDIEELLEAGIDVATTVNVQHIESLRDVVAQVTGVFVAETVPDSFFELVSETELVDLPAEELQQRLREGKIYGQEKVEQALQGFFKKGNLLALRELALRHTAERVDKELRQTRAGKKSSVPWHTREKILVCLAPNRMAPRIIRTARRLANSLHAGMVAVYVTSSRQQEPGERAKAELDAAMTLAERLGAEVALLSADDIAKEIVAFARSENVTTIVMGKPIKGRLQTFFSKSIVEQTIREAGDIDVLVISGEEIDGPLIQTFVRPKFEWQGLVEAMTWVVLVSGISKVFELHLRHADIAMLFILGVVGVSSRRGRNEAILSGILSVLAYDFFFVPPEYSFSISDPRDFLTFFVLLAVSLILSTLTIRLKEQSKETSARERNTSTLYELSRKLAGTRSKTEMAQLAVEKIRYLVGSDAAVFRRTSSRDLGWLVASSAQFENDPKEQAVAMWVVDHGRPAGSTTDTLAGARGLYLPLIGSSGTFGALAVDLATTGSLNTTQRHVVEAVANLLSTALERAQFAKASHAAALKAESERMRGDLLSAVSHDLRTPLASITGAASGLCDHPEVQGRNRELAETIRQESDRLSRLVRNLLDMTKVQGAVELNLDWHTLEEVVETAVIRTETLFDHPVRVVAPHPPTVVKVDGVLMEQVVVNLLENASRHGGRDCHVTVTVDADPSTAWLEVVDDGPGLPDGDPATLFERFRSHGQGGFGLGLAISKAAVEAHKGTLTAKSLMKGASFRAELPIRERPPADRSTVMARTGLNE